MPRKKNLFNMVNPKEILFLSLNSKLSKHINLYLLVEAQGCEYEQHISIIKNPSPGSGSMTHFAFPELHPNVRRMLHCYTTSKRLNISKFVHSGI